MPYEKENIITEASGNNAFAWNERKESYGTNPTLFVPCLIEGDIGDVRIGEKVVFEEMERKTLNSCIGLRNFVHIPSHVPPITIFDNHNHALYFWINAI